MGEFILGLSRPDYYSCSSEFMPLLNREWSSSTYAFAGKSLIRLTSNFWSYSMELIQFHGPWLAKQFLCTCRQTTDGIDIKLVWCIDNGTAHAWLTYGHAHPISWSLIGCDDSMPLETNCWLDWHQTWWMNNSHGQAWFTSGDALLNSHHFLTCDWSCRFCTQTADWFDIKLGGWTHYMTSEARLSLGHVLLNLPPFLASHLSSSCHIFADKCLIGLTSHFQRYHIIYVWYVYVLPKFHGLSAGRYNASQTFCAIE